MNSRTTSRKPIAVLCLWAIAAMLPLAGCASSRSGQSWFPAWPVAPAPAPVNTLSLRPQGLDPPVTRISEETASLLEHRPTPRSSDPPVLLARAELGPLGRAAAEAVLRADETTFEQQVLRSDVPVLVDFGASWCGPAKGWPPRWKKWPRRAAARGVVKVDVDESPELAARYGVRSVPRPLVFRDGQVVAKEKAPSASPGCLPCSTCSTPSHPLSPCRALHHRIRASRGLHPRWR